MCPKGDDPLTPFTDYRSITITINQLYATPTGSYKFTFDGQSVALPTSVWTNQDCIAVIGDLPNVQDVQCGIGANGRYGGYTISLQFLSFPAVPYQNNFYYHEGDPPLSSFYCDTSGVTTTGYVSCTIDDVSGDTYPGKRFCYFLLKIVNF